MKIRFTLIPALLITFIITFQSCDPNSEPNLFNYGFQTITPYQDQVFDTSFVQFHWYFYPQPNYYRLFLNEEVDGQPGTQILDTILYSDYFNYSLGSGNYVWRVLAANNVSASSSDEITFRIDTTINSDFAKQIITITSPIDSAEYEVGDSIILSWNAVEDVSRYELLIIAPTFDKGEKIILEELYTSEINRVENLTLDSGSYEWGIRAYKTASGGNRIYTPYSTRRLFIVPNDTTSN